MADGVVGAAEAARIAQFGDDRGRRHRPDAIQARDQRAAARLPAGEERQRAVERRQLQIDPIDHPQRQRHQLAARRGKLDPGNASRPPRVRGFNPAGAPW